MKHSDQAIQDTLREMAESVNPPEDMWEHIRKRLDLGGRVIVMPQRTAQLHGAPPAVPHRERAERSIRPYAGLLGLTAAAAAVAVMFILPSRETMLFQSSPLSVASAPAISSEVQAAEQPSTAGVSIPGLLVVRN